MKKTALILLSVCLAVCCGCGTKTAAAPDFTQRIFSTVSFNYDDKTCTLELDYRAGSMKAEVTSPPGMSRLYFRGEGGRLTLGCDDISQSFEAGEISVTSPARILYSCLAAAESADYGNPELLQSVNDDGGGTYLLNAETGDFLLTCNGSGDVLNIAPKNTETIFTFVKSVSHG